MNSDIRLQLSFRNHPKVKRLRRLLGPGGPLAFIFLLMFCAESRPDGSLAGLDTEDIATAAEWDGDPAELVQAMVTCRLLDQRPEGYAVHDWAEHNPFAAGAKDRSERAKNAASIRWAKEKSDAMDQDQCDQHANRMRPAQGRNAPSPSPSPSPDPSPGEETPTTAPSEPGAERSLLPEKREGRTGTTAAVTWVDRPDKDAPVTPIKIVTSPQPEAPPVQPAQVEVTYRTKRGRTLSGWHLVKFEEFWTAFELKQGRAEAADAWLDVPGLDEALAARIIEAAKIEAHRRPGLVQKGQSPKWAQGWLSGRRWEDFDPGGSPQGGPPGLADEEVDPLTAQLCESYRANEERRRKEAAA